ncbi:putative duf1649 domain protein [Eutypa lata UCREL1]|uniref:Autophagy-related protein 101 n=1 Tax=Eutypa lata (strain UCR-EL1) TaxID=1287681 RepID=M7TEX3_EUTLA|nr:putative duf1649 domain protein [Eutypa lata UCREL1]
MMDSQTPQEFILEAFADPASVRDVVKGILHTIFFHRFFPPVTPRSREVLDITLPYVGDAELDTMIEKRADELAQQLDAERSTTKSSSGGGSNRAGLGRGLGGLAGALGSGSGAGAGGDGRGTITVQFFEKKRRKAWYGGRDEEVCWESWTLKVTVAEPRTESERAKVRNAMEQTLSATIMKLVTCVNTQKDHIPPITTSEANPFPYQINVNPGTGGGVGSGDGATAPGAGWTTRMGIY